MIKNALKISMTETDKLIPYAMNSRTHSPEQVAQIAASIKEFGFTNPILTDGENGIIAGHGRVMAAQKLGLESVPCIELAHLTSAQRRAYIIADNKLALNAGWDEDILKLEIEALGELNFDLNKLGFEEFELSNMFDDGVRDETSPDDFSEASEFDMRHQCPKCGFEFD